MENAHLASYKKRKAGGNMTPNNDAFTMASTNHHSRLGKSSVFEMKEINKQRAALGLINKRRLDPIQFSQMKPKENDRMYNTVNGFKTAKNLSNNTGLLNSY